MNRILVACAVGVLLILAAVVAANAARDCTQWPAWPGLEARARAAQPYATQREVGQFYAIVMWDVDCKTKLRAAERLIKRVEARVRRS